MTKSAIPPRPEGRGILAKNLMNNGFRYAYLKETNRLVKAEEVENGIKCNCICPICKENLIAYNKGLKMSPHFRHDKNKECNFNNETVIHFLAKEYFEKSKTIYIPFNDWLSSKAFFKLDVFYHSIIDRKTIFNKHLRILEVKLEQKEQNIKPDITITVEYEEKKYEILVEIAVTHFIDEEKKQKLNKLNKNCIEIDLSELKKKSVIDKLDIFNYLDSSLSYKKYKIINQSIYKESFFVKTGKEKIVNSLLGKTIKIPVNDMKQLSFSYKGKTYIERIGSLERSHLDFDIKKIEFPRNYAENFKIYNGSKWLEIVLYAHEYGRDFIARYINNNISVIMFFISDFEDVELLKKQEELNHYWIYNIAEEKAIKKIKANFKKDFGNDKAIQGAFSRREFTFDRFYKTN